VNTPLIVTATLQQDQQEAAGALQRFRSLLESKGINPSKPIMTQLIKHYAASGPLITDPEMAADLYFTVS
jgi:hypothetical protein